MLVDASLLQFAQIGFTPYTDPRMLDTVKRIEKELLSADGFLHRHSTGVDGIAGEESHFRLCTFGLLEQYAHFGRLRETCQTINRVLQCPLRPKPDPCGRRHQLPRDPHRPGGLTVS